VIAETSVPVIAAGGIATASDVRHLSGLGAAAVQVGTALLAADEAGTKPTHLHALKTADAAAQTVVTRSFTGRPARALANSFTRRHSHEAPALYPELHALTSPIRTAAAAAGDPDHLHLWAGTGFGLMVSAPAARIVETLAGA
jgi:nitronate monooxygenase